MNDNYIIIHEKIPKIEKSSNIKINSKKNEYDISNNFFNPNKSSPQNEFINKLLLRIRHHEYEMMSRK